MIEHPDVKAALKGDNEASVEQRLAAARVSFAGR